MRAMHTERNVGLIEKEEQHLLKLKIQSSKET
jgi:hypothetical protein